MAWSRLLLDQDRNRALVVGASIAGPMIASVMINHFDEAIALDPEELPEALLPPCRVPQKHYVRLLLERARKIMSEYLPESWPRRKADERKESTSAS